MKSCDVKKGTKNAQNLHDNKEERIFYKSINLSKEDRDMLDKVKDFFKSIVVGTGEAVTNKEKQDFLNREYGNDAERHGILINLLAVLEANPQIREMIHDLALIQVIKTHKKTAIIKDIQESKELLKTLPPYKESYTKKEEKQIKDFADKHGVEYKGYEPVNTILKAIHLQMGGFNYSSLSVGSLRFLYNSATELIENGFGERLKGVLGKFRLSISTALGLAKSDASGSIYSMAKKITSYTSDITKHINRFLENNAFKDTISDKLNNIKLAKKRNYGMNKIFEMFEAFAARPDVLSEEFREILEYPDEKAVDFFNRLLSGWVFWDEERMEYMIHSTYDRVPDGKGGWLTYESTGDPIYKYQNPVSFRDYLKKRNETRKLTREEKGERDRFHRSFFIDENYVKMVESFSSSKENVDIITDLHDKAMGIHDEVFLYAKEQFSKAHNQLMIELKQYFPGLDNDEIQVLLESRNLEKEEIFQNLSEEQQDQLKYIVDAFGSYSILDPYFFGAQGFEEKAGTFPIIYNQDYFQSVMWEEALNEAKIRHRNAESRLNTARSAYMADKKNLELQEVYRKLKEEEKALYSEVARMEMIRDRLDEYPQDLKGNIVPLARDVAPLKRITNSFDVRNQRADKLVYSEYLNRMFSGLERNKLSIQLLKSLRTAKSKEVKDAIVSQYKGINNDPTARSHVMGVPIDLATVTVFINQLPLVNISTDTLSRKIRTFNSWITGMHLRRGSSALLNYTAIQEGFFHLGMKTMFKARKIMNQQKDAVERLVTISGIVDFSEFIQQGLVRKATDMEFTEKQADKVVMAILKYWKDIASGRNKNAALRELREHLVIEAENIPGAGEVSPSSRIKKRQKMRRSKKIKRIVNTFANYAIEKQYDMKPTIKNVPYKVWGKTWMSWGQLQREFNMSMGVTEKKLRTWQFMAGIVSAMEADLIPQVPFDQLEGTDLEAAIEIGRQYVQLSAFSVGRENIGEIARGEVGAFLTKFKYYGMQKFAADLDKFSAAFKQLQKETEDGEKESSAKTMTRLLAMTFKFRKVPQTELRTTHPEVATFRSWIAIQGVLTSLFDLIIFGPFAAAKFIPGARNLIYALPGVRTLGGMTSDLISLSLLVPNTLLALSFGWGEDEDDIQDLFEYYMRRTMIGYGVTWSYDNFLLLLSMMRDSDDEEKARNIKKALSPVMPKDVDYIPGRPVDKGIGWIVEEYLD
jgi:hypothetical protein